MVSLIILGFFIVFYTLKAFLIAPLVAAQRKRYVQEKQKEEACRLKKELEDIKKMNLSIDKKIELIIESNPCFLHDDKIMDTTHLVHEFSWGFSDVDDLKSKIEYVFNINVQKGGFSLIVGNIKRYVQKKLHDPTYIVDNKDLDFWPETLEEMLYREFNQARQLAIQQLIDNNYQILNDESGNRHKELINFTLNFFSKLFKDKPVEDVNVTLQRLFPLMHQFIYRQIFKKQNIISIESNFNEQGGYDEFLYFCGGFFLNYKDKNKLNIVLEKNFKYMHNDMAKFIENQSNIISDKNPWLNPKDNFGKLERGKV